MNHEAYVGEFARDGNGSMLSSKVFRSVAFGLTTGPLSWGRGSHKQRSCRGEAHLHCFVDDAGSSRRERSGINARARLFWPIFGIPVNWKKPRHGLRLDWIGFEFHIRPSGFDTGQDQHKPQGVRGKYGMNSTPSRRQWLGSGVGMPSVVPRARPCVSHLWGAFRPPRMARQPRNTGPRHSSSNDGWNTQCIG